MKIVKRLIIMLMCLTLTGCMMSASSYDEEEEVVATTDSNVQEVASLARDFIDCISYRDYERILEMVYLPEGSFVRADDIGYYLEKSSYADLLGEEITISEISLNGTTVEKVATLTIAKNSYLVNLRKGDDSVWKVVIDDAYYENFNIKVPTNCAVLLDGESLESYKKQSYDTEIYDTYAIGAIVPREYTLTVTSSLYGDFTQSVSPKSSSDIYTFVCKLNDSETNNILNSVKEIWNSIYQASEQGLTVPDIKKYFVNDFDTNTVNTILNTSIKVLKGSSYQNFIMSSIQPWTTDNYGSALLYGNNIVQVTFGYRLEFTDGNGQYHNLNKVTTLYMAYEDGVYKIYQLGDSTLFSDNDYTNNDF